eukprot:5268863-Amphidinium_carterae.1
MSDNEQFRFGTSVAERPSTFAAVIRQDVIASFLVATNPSGSFENHYMFENIPNTTQNGETFRHTWQIFVMLAYALPKLQTLPGASFVFYSYGGAED